jgi:RimJ/RimL family protein N-acetyltransferase
MTTSSQPALWTPPATPPQQFLTKRLTLRWYEPEDASMLFESVNASRAAMLPWLPWCKDDYHKPADATFNIEWFRRWRDGGHDPEFKSIPGYVLGVFLTASNQLVGGIGLARLFRASHTAEIGYWTDSRHTRNGYCAEATRGLISWAFTPQSQGGWGFRRVHIFASSANTASCAVPKSIGLHQFMRARQDRWTDGLGFTDTLGWDVLLNEWDVQSQRKIPMPEPKA